MTTGAIILWWLILILVGIDIFQFFQNRAREQRRRDELYDRWRKLQKLRRWR